MHDRKWSCRSRRDPRRAGPDRLRRALLDRSEPCVHQVLEGESGAAKLAETVLFALTRAVVIGGLGAIAVLIGSVFTEVQRGAWIALGVLYASIGLLLVTGRAGALMVSLGPSLHRLAGARGSLGLGALSGSTSRPVRRPC